MAFHFSISHFFTVLCLYAATFPVTHGQLLYVTGQVCCTATGNCPGTGLAGATARLVCNDPTIAQSPGITTTDGFFNIRAASTRFSFRADRIPTCAVHIGLPVLGCTTLTSGELVSAPINVTSINVTSINVSVLPFFRPVFRQFVILNATATGFSVQP